MGSRCGWSLMRTLQPDPLQPPPLPFGGLRPTVSLRSPQAPKAPDAPRAQKAPEGNFCPLCTPTLSFNQSLTLKSTPTLRLVLILPLPLAVTLTPIKTQYWDRAGGGGNISYDW